MKDTDEASLRLKNNNLKMIMPDKINNIIIKQGKLNKNIFLST